MAGEPVADHMAKFVNRNENKPKGKRRDGELLEVDCFIHFH